MDYMVSKEGLDATYNFIKGLELDKIRKIKVRKQGLQRFQIGLAVLNRNNTHLQIPGDRGARRERPRRFRMGKVRGLYSRRADVRHHIHDFNLTRRCKK